MDPQPLNSSPTPPSVPQIPIEQKPPHSNRIFKIILLVFLFLLLAAIIVYAFQTYQQPPQSNGLPKPEDIASPTPEENTEWKTYRNDEYGLEFKYPGNWSEAKAIPDFGLEIEFNYNDRLAGMLNIRENYNQLTEKPFDSELQDYLLDKSIQLEDKNIGMISGKYYIEENEVHSLLTESVVFFSQDKKYVIRFTVFPGYYDENVPSPLFDQILSSFRFIEENKIDTTTWKTYRSQAFGFEMKIPDHLLVVSEQANLIELGFDPEKDGETSTYLEITKDYSERSEELPLCTLKPQMRPCLNSWQVNEEPKIESVTIDNIAAKSFYVYYGADADYHFVQTTNPKIELKMYVSGGGLDNIFNQILSTFKFLQ